MARGWHWYLVAIVVVGGIRSAAAAPSCTPGHVLPPFTVAGAGVASSPASDASLNPGTKGSTYLLQGNRLVAYDNSTGAQRWTHTFTSTFLNTTEINPVQLSGSGSEWLFLVADGSLVYKISADGNTVISTDVASIARTSCPRAQPGDLSVVAAPAIQLCMFSNTSYTGGVACTDQDDLVIVPTHFINCDGYNRILALRASDLALPGAGVARSWAFGNSGTFVIDPASDDCQVVYDSTASTPPFNNTVICGTDRTNPLHNTLWALNTHPTGAFAFLGSRVWSIDGGAILGRPAVKPGTSRIYYGTDNGGVSGTFRVKNLTDGSDIYAVAVANPIVSPVWPEFRPPVPGLTNMTMVVDALGVFRRFVESASTTMSELAPTLGRPNSMSTAGTFTQGVAVLPSAGRVYVGENNGTVRQMDPAICDNGTVAANEGYFQFSTAASNAFRPTLDFNDFATSTDIDRVSMVNDAGELLRFCVPDGDGTSYFANMTRPRDGVQVPVGCSTPQFAGDCTCDAQCANYAPASACYHPTCQIRNGATEGTCVLSKAPNGTACDNGNSCDCSLSHVGAGVCDTSTCGGMNCDECIDGVCIGTFRSGCACNQIGDLACDTSQGQSCCGAGVCADLRSSNTNCGQCGRACAAGFKCSNGSCLRDFNSCNTTQANVLNNAVAAGRLPGGSAIEYTFDGTNNCMALVSLINGTTNSFVERVDPAGNVVSYAPFDATGATRLLMNVGGVSSTPDGLRWYANIFSMDMQSVLVVEQTPWTSNRFLEVTPAGAVSPTVPFPIQLYNDGFENRPAIHLKAYNAGQFRVFESNLIGVGGTIGLVNPAVPNGGQPTCFTTAQNDLCTAGAPFEALEYAIRGNGDGVLLAAQGTTLRVICDDAFTNQGAPCRVNSFGINLTSASIYPNTDPTGTAYIPAMDRIYSIAVDRARGSIFVELGTSTASQDVMIEDASLSSLRAVVRNVFDVETEHGLNHGTLQATYADVGGRLAVSKNGILTRIGVSRTAPSGQPTFFSGQIP